MKERRRWKERKPAPSRGAREPIASAGRALAPVPFLLGTTRRLATRAPKFPASTAGGRPVSCSSLVFGTAPWVPYILRQGHLTLGKEIQAIEIEESC